MCCVEKNRDAYKNKYTAESILKGLEEIHL